MLDVSVLPKKKKMEKIQQTYNLDLIMWDATSIPSTTRSRQQ